MSIADYLEDMADDMRHKSAAIRRDFARHRPSAGTNREDIVEQFLLGHLPKRFGVSSGLVFSHDNMFSKQADLIVVDGLNNAPLYPQSPNKLWPVEAVYALVEVKTHLNPDDMRDAIQKGRRFKTLARKFCETGSTQRLMESLFVIWAFESSDPKTLKQSLLEMLRDVPSAEQPDLIVVPDRLVARSGSYRQVASIGQPTSLHRQRLESRYGPDLSGLVLEPVEVWDLGTNSLLVWYLWFDSWLRQAGPRFVNPLDYLPSNRTWGKRV